LDTLDIPSLVCTFPAGPQLDSGTVGPVTIVRKVDILFSVRNTDPVGIFVPFVRPDIPTVRFRSAYDPFPVLDPASIGEVGTLLGIPDLPAVVYSGEVPLLISPFMATPTLDGLVVAGVEIDGGSRLLVDDVVAISRLDGHSAS